MRLTAKRKQDELALGVKLMVRLVASIVTHVEPSLLVNGYWLVLQAEVGAMFEKVK